MSFIKRPQSVPTISVLNGEKTGVTYEIRDDVTLIGRSALCQVVLDRKSVSRRHAQVVREGDDFYLENLSRNGVTRVNNRSVGGRVSLRDGSMIEIGRYRFAFHNPAFRVADDDEGSSRILGQLNLSTTAPARVSAVTAEAKLLHVLEISRNLYDTLHLDAVLTKTLDALFKIFPQAERGFVVLKEGDEMDDVPRAFRFRGDEQGDMTISRTIFNHVMEECQAILSVDVENDSRFNESPSILSAQFRTMMCVPLFDQDRRPTGILQIDSRNDPAQASPGGIVPFCQDDLDLLAAVAVPVGVAIDNARLHAAAIHQTQIEQETDDAREVQKALLPAHRPELPGYEFWDYYEPAHFVGGDYFDYLPIAPAGHHAARWALAVGDVVGKGMSAALLMARLSAEVRLLVLSGLEPGAVVARLNDNFARAGMERRFITFLLILIDGESHQMTVVNAGHMGPIIHRASGATEVFGEDEASQPLGIYEGVEYRAVSTDLGAGDRVVLYTDGINEAIDAAGQCLGTPRLRQTIHDAPGPVAQLGSTILRAVGRHSAAHPQNDDITLLCFGRT